MNLQEGADKLGKAGLTTMDMARADSFRTSGSAGTAPTALPHGELRLLTAAELAEPAFREKAVSRVLAGGLVGAVVGPNLANHTRNLFSIPFLGAYLAVHLGGAGNPSTTRTLVAWLFEVPWLIAFAFFAVRAWRQHVAYRTATAEYNAPRAVAGPGGSTVYHHGACVINHKTVESAAKCRKG